MNESSSTAAASQPVAIPDRSAAENTLPTARATLPLSVGAKSLRSGHLNLDTFSLVNQNGSFEFDRVLKSGEVYKRTRKTKAWKPVYLVLRPNLLSIYKDPQESKLRHQINLSDLTAVAVQKDRKQKRQHVFGLFSPSRNYHLEASSAAELRAWVELIRQEARIDEEEQEMNLASPGGHDGTYKGFERHMQHFQRQQQQQQQQLSHHEHERFGSSSPEPTDLPLPLRTTKTRDGIRIPSLPRPSSRIFEHSGNEMSSFSDLSDAPGRAGYRESSLSLSQPEQYDLHEPLTSPPQHPSTDAPPNPQIHRSASQTSDLNLPHTADERVVWQGHLQYLRSKGGVRQWKRSWVVLRPKNLAFYKNDDEYRAHLLIPLSTILSAVEIDPISKTKRHCMQIIVEDKSYRFCAPDEAALEKWLGCLKSLLAKRREREKERERADAAGVSTAAAATNGTGVATGITSIPTTGTAQP
ncbi:MAG: hypothetical protein M1824_005488 [Vezdaea acicularis]|nr:MAG: hypothetical protein M1824_005488 [Vezdaea acicularis]